MRILTAKSFLGAANQAPKSDVARKPPGAEAPVRLRHLTPFPMLVILFVLIENDCFSFEKHTF
jgi:hypothetical protein